jgi:hypothetical protein
MQSWLPYPSPSSILTPSQTIGPAIEGAEENLMNVENLKIRNRRMDMQQQKMAVALGNAIKEENVKRQKQELAFLTTEYEKILGFNDPRYNDQLNQLSQEIGRRTGMKLPQITMQGSNKFDTVLKLDRQGLDREADKFDAQGDHEEAERIRKTYPENASYSLKTEKGRTVELKPVKDPTQTEKSLTPEQLTHDELRQKLGREPTAAEIKGQMEKDKVRLAGSEAAARKRGGLAGEFAGIGGMGAPGGAAPAPGTPAGPGMGAPTIEGRNEAALQQVPENMRPTVKAMADYRFPVPTGFSLRSPYWQTMVNWVQKYDPSFDATQYQVKYRLRQDFTSGKAAQNLLGLNTAVGHIDSLVNAYKDLDQSNWPSKNYATNLLANHFPVTQGLIDRQGKLTAVKTKFNAVKGEMASIFKKNGATDQEIKAWRDTIDDPTTATPTMWKHFIGSSLELMGSRMEALENQYEQGMQRPKDFRFLSDKSRKILHGLGVNVDAIDPVNAAPSGAMGVDIDAINKELERRKKGSQ